MDPKTMLERLQCLKAKHCKDTFCEFYIPNPSGDRGWCDHDGLVDDITDELNVLLKKKKLAPVLTRGDTRENTWWYVCGNCFAPIDPGDRYCRKCGRRMHWDDKQRKGY